MNSRSYSEALTRAIDATPYKPGRLARAVSWQAAPLLVAAGSLYFLQILFALCTPIFINLLLIWIENGAAQVTEGVIWIIVLTAASILGFIATDRSERLVKKAGVWARAAVCGVLVNKALRARLVDTKQEVGDDEEDEGGEVHNLFTIDAQALEDFFDGAMRLILQVCAAKMGLWT